MNKYLFLTKELLSQEYQKLKTLSAISCKYNIPLSTIKYYSKKLNIQTDKPGAKCKYSVNENIFSEDSEIGFYVAGFIAADGCITHDKRSDTSLLRIGLSRKDKQHLLTIKDAINFSGPIIDYEIFDKKYQTTNFVSNLQVSCSKKIIKDLENNFNIITNKTLTYQFPSNLLNHKFVNHFIRGYFDGDGCFSIDKRNNAIIFELLGTKLFLNSVKNILEKECNLYQFLNVLPFKNIFRLRYSAEQSVTNIVKFLYKEATIYLPRKLDIVNHLI